MCRSNRCRVAPMNTVQACRPLVFHYFSSNASGVGGLYKTNTVTSSTVNQISTDLDVTKNTYLGANALNATVEHIATDIAYLPVAVLLYSNTLPGYQKNCWGISRQKTHNIQSCRGILISV